MFIQTTPAARNMAKDKIMLGFVFIVVISITSGIKSPVEERALKHGCYGNVCWTNRSYPIEKVNRKMLVEPSLLETVGRIDHLEAFGKSVGSCKLCNSIVNMKVRPLSIIDKGKKYFIVTSKYYKQIEIILNVCSLNQDESKCSTGWSPNNFVKECKQKYTKMKVLAYDEMKNKFVGKSFSYPSACECIIINVL